VAHRPVLILDFVRVVEKGALRMSTIRPEVQVLGIGAQKRVFQDGNQSFDDELLPGVTPLRVLLLDLTPLIWVNLSLDTAP
jgi:hypothetical protein